MFDIRFPAQRRAPRKLKVLQAFGQHKKMPYGIIAADYKYAENEIFR
jgi:hypothetical protein